MRRLGAAAVLALVTACGSRDDGGTKPTATAAETSGPSRVGPPPRKPTEPNPLELPPRKLEVVAGQAVFAVPERMLRGARLGSSMALELATVSAIEGDDLVVEQQGTSAYRVHGAYVIPLPQKPRLRLHEPVLVERGGRLRHGVVTRFDRDAVVVRMTDGEAPFAEVAMRDPFLAPQRESLAPGSFAARVTPEGAAQVLLVSSFVRGDRKLWLALGQAGASQLVEESELVAVPVKLEAKVGEVVWAETKGMFRRGAVEATPQRGLFTVRFERAGRPETVGWGSLLKADALSVGEPGAPPMLPPTKPAKPKPKRPGTVL